MSSEPVNTTNLLFKLNSKSSNTDGDSNSLRKRYEKLLHSEKYYDCVFHICDSQVRCHKLLLAVASPVFEAMFYGPMQESQPLQIEITDISADIFQVLIEYIYTDHVDYTALTLVQTIELHYSAEKYLLDKLNTQCLEAISKKLRYTNILSSLDLGVRMHLDKLLDKCLKFFRNCCFSDTQFSSYFEEADNYVHVTKECLKVIWWSLTYEEQKQFLWFVLLWCRHESEEYGMQKCDKDILLLSNLDLNADDIAKQGAEKQMAYQAQMSPNNRERCYYKATRPFYVDYQNSVWKLQIKSDRFIILQGIVMQSRLTPQVVQLLSSGCKMHSFSFLQLPNDYNEELSIEISSFPCHEQEDQLAVDTMQKEKVWQHNMVQQSIKFNCDVNIDWPKGIILSPDKTYELKISWPESAYGAEYPCNLFSNEIDGIRVQDINTHAGSFIKGLRFTDVPIN